jgi:branched-chain amino acid transport system substrate-binding protein
VAARPRNKKINASRRKFVTPHFDRFSLVMALGLAVIPIPASADINIGVLMSSTGPAATIGNAEKNGAAFGPAEIAGQKVNYIAVDEASDTTAAVTGLKKLIQESNIDALIGPTTTPGSFAIIDTAAEAKVTMITMAPTNALVSPVDAKRRWVFKTTPNDEHEATPLFENMKKAGVKRLAVIGFADPYGESWSKVAADFAKRSGIEIVADEKYARTDTSVVGQVLKIVAAKPDAVLIAASAAPAALPVLQLREKGYRGALYGTLGATFGDFRKLTGARGDGIFVPLSPAIGADSFPDSYPAKKAALEFIAKYEGKFGADTRNIFAGSGYDAAILIARAVPEALKAGKPGTLEFREGLRTGIENLKGVMASRGEYNLGPNNHTGLDQSSLLLGKLDQGKWVLVP